MIHNALGMAWLAAVQLQAWLLGVLRELYWSSCLEIRFWLLHLLSNILRVVLVHGSWVHLLVDVWILTQRVQTLTGVLSLDYVLDQSLRMRWLLIDWVPNILVLIEGLTNRLIHISILTIWLLNRHSLRLLLEVDATIRAWRDLWIDGSTDGAVVRVLSTHAAQQISTIRTIEHVQMAVLALSVRIPFILGKSWSTD